MYDCASTAGGLPSGVRLLYSVDTTSSLLRVALSTPGRGWVSLAWTSDKDAGEMAPATAYVGRLLGNGTGEVRALALHKALYSGDVGAGTTALSDAAAAPLDSSVVRDAAGTTLRFSRRLGSAPSESVVAVKPDSPSFLNWAWGESDVLRYHGSNRGSFVQAFTAPPAPALGAGGDKAARAPAPATLPGAERAAPVGVKRAGPTPTQKRGPPPSRLRTHGRLMLVAWVCLLPFGAAVGRFVQLPAARGRIFKVHVFFQVSGVVVATVAFALIVAGASHVRLLPYHARYYLTRSAAALRHVVRFDDPHRIPYAHGKVGVAAMVLLWAQPLNGMLRPHVGVSRRRRAWELVHALLGRAALVLGIVNTFTGIWILGRELHLVPFPSWAAWSAVSLGAIWLAGAAVQKLIDQHGRIRTAASAETTVTPTRDAAKGEARNGAAVV